MCKYVAFSQALSTKLKHFLDILKRRLNVPFSEENQIPFK